MKVLKNAIMEYARKGGKNKFLIDGFPRNFENLKGWNQVFGKDQSIKIQFVLYFDCPESEMEKRLIKRGETSGREDDNAIAIKKRFKTYIEETRPIIEYYKQRSLLKTISAVGTQDQVFQRVEQAFKINSAL
jgi:UMP-CMP kinase